MVIVEQCVPSNIVHNQLLSLYPVTHPVPNYKACTQIHSTQMDSLKNPSYLVCTLLHGLQPFIYTQSLPCYAVYAELLTHCVLNLAVCAQLDSLFPFTQCVPSSKLSTQ